MPDHWHALLSLQAKKTLPQVVLALCRHASFNSRKLGRLLWQTGFHDHKVRSGESVVDIVRYIENNPVRKQLVVRQQNGLGQVRTLLSMIN
ncbi:MAG: IS200/IS605 family transposase [Verrucomicrobia bacterium]|nr:MAG: IS200/IS605 family transposase [Verrucomicrobiota bacterium]